MSLTTGFNFKGFQCDLNRETAERKLGVSLSALTSSEMERIGFVKVKGRLGHEDKAKPWRPIVDPKTGEELATFWDTRMGNFDVKSFPTQPCGTCAAVEIDGKGGNPRCQGHFGYIEMPLKGPENWLLVYNPLLFQDLVALTQATCFFCHRFRAPLWDTTRLECALQLVDAGLVGEGLYLLHTFPKVSALGTSVKRVRDPTGAISTQDMSALHQQVAAALNRAKKSDVPSLSQKDDGSALITPHPSVMDVRSKMVMEALRELKSYSQKCFHCGATSPKMTSKFSQIYFKFSKTALEVNKLLSVVSQQQANDWECEREVHRRERQLLQTEDCCEMMHGLCGKYSELIGRLFPNLGSSTVQVPFDNVLSPAEAYRVFFLDRVLVPPLPLRLASGIQIQPSGAISADDRSRELNDILKYSEEIEEYYRLALAGNASSRQMVANEQNVKSLQLKVDAAYQSVLDRFSKKEGLFRMNMMGKRVNQACRSVISPDFTVEPNEVLLPRPFARNLTFPEIVSFLNANRLAFLVRCVVNGPQKYPGATHIERREADGKIDIVPLDGSEKHRQEIVAQFFALAQHSTSVITVHRHVVDGDRLIFNRQPTLHRPSMMGYRARVLSNLKTLRFHYVNGKSFNADFDGDEMNVHVPQSLEGRAELESIMDSNMNFLVATSGRPIRGLIQDHLVAGVLLTIPDTLFSADEFQQFLYSALEPYMSSGRVPPMGSMIPVPCILMPYPLWSGKQLVSVILKWITGVFQGNAGVTTRGRAQVPSSAWCYDPLPPGKSPSIPNEHNVVFLHSEMLSGVLDKAQLGPTHLSVPHIIHDVYGPHAVGDFFGAIGRLLTIYLRTQGFSMGVDDMLMQDPKGRRQRLEDLDLCALTVDGEDLAVQAIGGKASSLVNEYIPNKLTLPFPQNQLILMTLSGAKGSNVNATQMALVLGQQLFDGLRVKRMSSGKTLPGFFCGENRARSFGFAMGRFVTGIRPQEYTIHAMAGRDGLIDTGVKTSRSGHLQRCLIKGLESLTVQWDGTVRDSDGSVVQFAYGGDGLDPTRASLLTEWQPSSDNAPDLMRRFDSSAASNKEGDNEFDEEEWGANVRCELDARSKVKGGKGSLRPPSMEDRSFKNAYVLSGEDDLPPQLRSSLNQASLRIPLNPKAVGRAMKKNQTVDAIRASYIDAKKLELEELTKKKIPRCAVDPGEAVGILAAQATGEPSTQMTLNTFHQAGQTASHVTEGIPRLRELIIHASVSNPAVVVPVANMGPPDHEAVQRVLAVASHIKLRSAFASIVEPFKWCVTRSEASTCVSVIMIFSEKQLNVVGHQLLRDKTEMKITFFEALKEFGRVFSRALRGVLQQGGAGSGGGGGEGEGGVEGLETQDGAFNVPVTDPADMEGPVDGENESEAEAEAALDLDYDEAQQWEQGGTTPKPFEAPQAVGDEDSSSDEGEGEGEGAHKKNRKRGRVDGEEEGSDDEDVAVGASKAEKERAKFKKASYSNFPPIDSTYEKKQVHVTIAPEQIPGVDADFVPIRITVHMPPSTVALIPAALDASLEVTFPVPTPQFETVRWVPNKKNDGGDLVFQGAGTSLRTVMSLLLAVAGDCNAIQVYRSSSTNYHDVANSLGVEAAYAGLSKEFGKLFARYSVDERHVSLIADNATRRGKWESYNFNGLISHDPSPIFQMTFASSTRFLHSAVSRGIPDGLSSLSSAIVVGEKPQVGTASVDVRFHPTALPDIVERQ